MMHSSENPFSAEVLREISNETPYFVFSKERIKEQVATFEEHFKGASIFYALKANSEIEVLDTIAKTGAGFEAASKYELEYLKEAGVPGKKILFGSSVKKADHIKAFHDYGVDRFAFDSPSELEKIAAMAPGARVYLRIRVNDTGSVFRFSEKFGTTVDKMIPLFLHAQSLGLIPYGVSFHVGSQASNPKAWAEALSHIKPSIDALGENGIQLEVIDLGGGFPCTYATTETLPALSEIAKETYAAYHSLGFTEDIILEPGRSIVAETGVLVASVIGRVEREESTWLFLDAGVYNGLFEVMAYQGSTRYPISSLRHSYESGESLFAIAGPTGDSPDVITREALLPSDIDIGDKLIIHKVGAYSLPAISPFNGFPKPPVYYL